MSRFGRLMFALLVLALAAGCASTRLLDDLRSHAYMRLVGASWNACQNRDGTLALVLAGACQPLRPGVRRTPIARSLERRAARSFVAGRTLVGGAGL